MKFSFTSTVQLFDDNLWFYHFLIPKDIAIQLLKLQSGRRVICSINQSDSFHRALMPDGLGNHFINLNKCLRYSLHLSENQTVNIELTSDTSVFGMPMPEEFEEMLNQSKKAHTAFNSLTPGKQRNLIYIVNQVKSSDIKLRRAYAVTQHLEAHERLDFKALNAEIKEANRNAKTSRS